MHDVNADAAALDGSFNLVCEVLQTEFDFAGEVLRLETHLIDELDLDSIDAIDLAVRLEERTGVSFQEEELKGMNSFGGANEYETRARLRLAARDAE